MYTAPSLLSNSPNSSIQEQELLKRAKSHRYKSTPKGDLHLHFIKPESDQPQLNLPVAIFFHNGLWDKQLTSQFVPQATHLVSLGIVAVFAEYRVSSIHKTTPAEAVEDAQSAILWLRESHQFLGIDPDRISAWGAGSGAHIALCAAMNKTVEDNGLYDSRPQCLILFSAIVDTTKNGIGFSLFESKKAAHSNSPNKNIRKKIPPSIFYHGTEDNLIPVADVENFCKKMVAKKNKCIFFPVHKGAHGFFNFNVNQEQFVQTLDSAVRFLREQGFLDKASHSAI